MILSEDKQLYRGIFWIPDIYNVQSLQLYFLIPCDNSGIIYDLNFTIPSTQHKTYSYSY